MKLTQTFDMKAGKMPNILKPCPWCGRAPILKHEKVGGDNFWSVECKNNDECPVNLVTRDFDSEEEAIETWNKREYC